MFKLHLVLKERSPSVVELTLPAGFRITFGIIALVFLGSMATLDRVSALPVAITAVTVVAGLYEERWKFDRGRGVVEHRYGLLVFSGRSLVDFGSIESFVLSNFREAPDDHGFSAQKSIALRSLVSLQLLTHDGKCRTIEIRANRHNDSLKSNAERIGEFCSIPLRIAE